MDPALLRLAVLIAVVLAAVALVIFSIVLALWALRWRPGHNARSLSEAHEGRQQTQIFAIEAGGEGTSLTIYFRNRSNDPALVVCEAGTLFLPPDPGLQTRIAVRHEAITVAPGDTGRLYVESPALEPRGRPLPPWGTRGYRLGDVTDNRAVLRLLAALQDLESEIAGHVQSLEGETARYKPMADDLAILSTFCTVRPNGQGGSQVRVAGRVVQHALWQVTAGLDLDGLADRLLGDGAAGKRARLVAEVLAANVLLREAGLEPSAVA
jgi:hypothetical protein